MAPKEMAMREKRKIEKRKDVEKKKNKQKVPKKTIYKSKRERELWVGNYISLLK